MLPRRKQTFPLWLNLVELWGTHTSIEWLCRKFESCSIYNKPRMNLYQYLINMVQHNSARSIYFGTSVWKLMFQCMCNYCRKFVLLVEHMHVTESDIYHTQKQTAMSNCRSRKYSLVLAVAWIHHTQKQTAMSNCRSRKYSPVAWIHITLINRQRKWLHTLSNHYKPLVWDTACLFWIYKSQTQFILGKTGYKIVSTKTIKFNYHWEISGISTEYIFYLNTNYHYFYADAPICR